METYYVKSLTFDFVLHQLACLPSLTSLALPRGVQVEDNAQGLAQLPGRLPARRVLQKQPHFTSPFFITAVIHSLRSGAEVFKRQATSLQPGCLERIILKDH